MKQTRPHHWTYADYLALPDDGTRCEIIEGDRVMAPAPFTRHQAVYRNLALLMVEHVRSNGLGIVHFAPCDVILADDVVLQPDILFVRKGRRRIIKERGIFGPPDLLVEVLSPWSTRRDTVRKLDLYGRYGVREYWIVDPDANRIDVHALEDGQLVRKARHASGYASSLAALPGFAARLAEVFERD